MIHRTMSLLRLFSSAMVSSTPHLMSRFKCRVAFPVSLAGYGFSIAVQRAGSPEP